MTYKFIDAYGRDNTWTEEVILACVGPGWSQLLKDLIRDLFAIGWNGELHQVKEKFGGLRFYIGEGSEAIFHLIEDAEERSFHICEDCGAPAALRVDLSWWRTLCSKCYPGSDLARPR